MALVLSLCISQSVWADVIITQDGQAKAVIVVSESAQAGDLSTKTLSGHLTQISGAKLQVVSEKELASPRVEGGKIIPADAGKFAENFIVLGEGELTKKLGVSLDGIGLGGILVKSSGNCVVVAGTSDNIAAKARELMLVPAAG